MMQAVPTIGRWYQRLDTGEQFEVVDIDRDEGDIQVQNFDGDLDVIGWTEWRDLEIEELGPSAGWTGPAGSSEDSDFGYDQDKAIRADRRKYRPGVDE